MSERAELDGLEVSLYRYKGKIIVDIDTSGLEGPDRFETTEVPNIRLRINEQGIELNADGDLLEVD